MDVAQVGLRVVVRSSQMHSLQYISDQTAKQF